MNNKQVSNRFSSKASLQLFMPLAWWKRDQHAIETTLCLLSKLQLAVSVTRVCRQLSVWHELWPPGQEKASSPCCGSLATGIVAPYKDAERHGSCWMHFLEPWHSDGLGYVAWHDQQKAPLAKAIFVKELWRRQLCFQQRETAEWKHAPAIFFNTRRCPATCWNNGCLKRMSLIYWWLVRGCTQVVGFPPQKFLGALNRGSPGTVNIPSSSHVPDMIGCIVLHSFFISAHSLLVVIGGCIPDWPWVIISPINTEYWWVQYRLVLIVFWCMLIRINYCVDGIV